MKKRLQSYILTMKQLTESSLSDEEKERVLNDLLIQIQFFQHERLIHLIVTVCFAMLTVLTFLFVVLTQEIVLVILGAVLLVLLVPYVIHYYILENGVQELYRVYDYFVK